jgi:hypothetical protein
MYCTGLTRELDVYPMDASVGRGCFRRAKILDFELVDIGVR